MATGPDRGRSLEVASAKLKQTQARSRKALRIHTVPSGQPADVNGPLPPVEEQLDEGPLAGPSYRAPCSDVHSFPAASVRMAPRPVAPGSDDGAVGDADLSRGRDSPRRTSSVSYDSSSLSEPPSDNDDVAPPEDDQEDVIDVRPRGKNVNYTHPAQQPTEYLERQDRTQSASEGPDVDFKVYYWETFGEVPIAHPPDLSHRPELDENDLFIHTYSNQKHQIWVWLTAKDCPSRWKLVDIGFKRLSDGRMLWISPVRAYPGWLIPSWYKKLRRRMRSKSWSLVRARRITY